MVGVGFYSYYIHKGNESDKERKIVRNKLSFMHTKKFNKIFKRLVKFRVVAILHLPEFNPIVIKVLLLVLKIKE